MDTLDDREVNSIWSRVKKYVDTSKLRSGSREEFVKALEREMQKAGNERGSQGSMSTLVRSGFADRVGEQQSVLNDFVQAPKAKAKPAPRPARKREELPPKLRQTSESRTSVYSRGAWRSYSSANVSTSYGTFKGTRAYYVSNARTGKRLTWGVFK